MTHGDIHIGFDLDGVLLDHTDTKLGLAASFGVKVPPERTSAAFFSGYFERPVYHELQERLYTDPVFSLRSPVMPGARETLRALRREGIRYTLVSRRRSADWALKVLEHHGLRPEYFDDDNTYFVRKPEEKNHVAVRVGITHYLDDELKILRALLDVPNRYLMDPHQAYEKPDDVIVVRTHEEFRVHVLGASATSV